MQFFIDPTITYRTFISKQHLGMKMSLIERTFLNKPPKSPSDVAGTWATVIITTAFFLKSAARSFSPRQWSAILLLSGSRRALNQREEEQAEKKNEQCTACRETRHRVTKPSEFILSTFLEILSLKYQQHMTFIVQNYKFSFCPRREW